MAVDRSKFRSAKVKKLKEQEQKAQESAPMGGGGGKFPKRIYKYPEGKSRYRILPIHPDAPEDTGSYFQQSTMHFLPFDVEEKKDGKTKLERKNRPVFNAKIHGSAKKDLVEEYMKLVEKVVTERCQDKDEQKEQLKAIYGHYDPKPENRVQGISATSSWELYAFDLENDPDGEEVVQLSIKASMRNQLNEIAEDEAADDPMGSEPFTDPDEGLPITIKFDNSKSGAEKYKISIPRSEKPYELSDEQLELLEATPSLESRFCNVYKRKDFDKAYEGLEVFDEEHDFDIFDMDEWHDIVEKLQEQYPVEDDEEESEEEEKKPAKKARKAAPKVEEEEDNEEEEAADLALEEMDKKQLREYIKENGLKIRILPRHSEDDIVEMIQEAESGSSDEEGEEEPDDLPFEEGEGEEVSVEKKPRRSFRDRKNK